MLVTVVDQFIAKEQIIYFLSLMSCSINKLKFHMLLSCKNFMFSNFTRKKKNCFRKWWWWGGGLGWLASPCVPVPYLPTAVTLFKIFYQILYFDFKFFSFFSQMFSSNCNIKYFILISMKNSIRWYFFQIFLLQFYKI